MSNPSLSKLFYTFAHFVDHYGLFKALHTKLKILIGFDLGFLQLLGGGIWKQGSNSESAPNI